MENKTLDELVKEHGFGVELIKKDTNQKFYVHSESKYWKDSYVCELKSGHLLPVSKKSTLYYFEKPRVKRAKYLLMPFGVTPVETNHFFKNEDDLWKLYDKSTYKEAIRLTETEREFDW